MQATLLYRRAIRLREREAGATVTWAGATYPCGSGASVRGKKLEIDGFAPESDLIVAIRRELLPSVPAAQQSVSYFPGGSGETRTYRIESVTTTPGDAFVQLALIDPSRGA